MAIVCPCDTARASMTRWTAITTLWLPPIARRIPFGGDAEVMEQTPRHLHRGEAGDRNAEMDARTGTRRAHRCEGRGAGENQDRNEGRSEGRQRGAPHRLRGA